MNKLLLSAVMVFVVTGTVHAAENIALNKPASQSSDYVDFVAGRAVDGNRDGDVAEGALSITDHDNQSWWQVDLGAIYTFDKISLWNRTDGFSERLSDFYVFVSNDNINLSHSTVQAMLDDPEISAYYVAQAGTQTDIEENFSGRFVRVQLKANNTHLQLAEVEVWTDFQPICGVVCTETVLAAEYEAGRQACIDNPDSCGINFPVDSDSATLSPGLDLHIPKLQYNGPFGSSHFWADLEYAGELNGELYWKLLDYGGQ